MHRSIKTALVGLLLLSPVAYGQAEILGVEPADAPAPADAQAPAAPLPRTPVLLLPFAQTAGDDARGWVGPAVYENLAGEMREAGFTLAQLPIDGPVQLAPAVDVREAQRLGVAARADLVVFGGYRSVENELRINGQVIDVATGRTVAELRAAGALRDKFMLEEMLLEQIDAAVRDHARPATQPGDLVDARPLDPARPETIPADDLPYTPDTAPAEPPYIESPGSWYPDYTYAPTTVYEPATVVYPEVYTSYSFFYGYYPYRYYYPYWRRHHHHHDDHHHGHSHFRDDRRHWFERDVQGHRGDRGDRFRDDFRRDDDRDRDRNRAGEVRSFRDSTQFARTARPSGHLGGDVARVNTPGRSIDSTPSNTGTARRVSPDSDASTARFRDRETYAPRPNRDRGETAVARPQPRPDRSTASPSRSTEPRRDPAPSRDTTVRREAPARDTSSSDRSGGRFRDSAPSAREPAPSRRESAPPPSASPRRESAPPPSASPRREPAPSRSSGSDARPSRSSGGSERSSADRGGSFRSPAPARDSSSSRSSSGGGSRSSSGGGGGRSSDSGGGRSSDSGSRGGRGR
jgi:TolB-like protein